MTVSTEVANIEKRPVAKVPVTTGNKLAAFVPGSIDEAWRLAGALAASGMTPRAYGNDQNKIMVGIIAGAEVGLTPFAALQSIAVIGNNPSLWGDGALALVQASGLLEDMEESDDGNEATCRMVRAGRPSPIIRTFNMDDAKKANLLGKQGPWTQYPARMRQMRARAWAMRDGFSDVLKGLHIAEEVRDYTPMGPSGQSQPARLTSGMLQAQAQTDSPEASRAASPNGDPPRGDTDEPETGRSDAEHGDQHDGIDDDPAKVRAQAICDEATMAENIIDLRKIEADAEPHLMAMPDELRAWVDAAFAAAQKRLSPK